MKRHDIKVGISVLFQEKHSIVIRLSKNQITIQEVYSGVIRTVKSKELEHFRIN